MHETENLTGVTGKDVSATIKSYTGFVHNENNNDVLRGTIAANGSTILKVYYDRETYTVTWKSEGNTLEVDENVKYGSKPSYNSATPTKADTNVTTGGNWTYNNMFARWMDGNNELTDSTTVTGNVTFNAQFMHLEPEINAGKQLEFEKGANVSEVRDVITVNVVYDDGTIKETNVSQYTLEGFDSSDYTENKRPVRSSDPLTTIYNGLHNDKLRYKIVFNAGTSKFEVEMSIPSANNDGKYEYIATKSSYCRTNCNQLSNTTYVEKRELDNKFLELTERYNSSVSVKNVYIKYKNGKTVQAPIATIGLSSVDGNVVIRYDYKTNSGAYHLPTRIAQVKGMDLREAYVRSEKMYISRNENYPENAFNGYGAPLTGKCTSNSCVYYNYTKNVGTYDSNTTYYKFNGTRYNSYTPSYNEIVDVELPEYNLVIDEVIITYHRDANAADNEDEGNFKVTYAYINGEFRVKSEVKVTSTTIAADSNVGVIYNEAPKLNANRSTISEPILEEKQEEMVTEEQIELNNDENDTLVEEETLSSSIENQVVETPIEESNEESSEVKQEMVEEIVTETKEETAIVEETKESKDLVEEQTNIEPVVDTDSVSEVVEQPKDVETPKQEEPKTSELLDEIVENQPEPLDE